MLIESKRLLRKASITSSGIPIDGGTIRFQVPQAKTESDRKNQVDEALGNWLNTGQSTLRHLIKISRKDEQSPSKSTAALRERAQIELRVAEWADESVSQHTQIDIEVRKWLSIDSASLRRPMSARNHSSKVDSAKAALRRPLSARGTSSEISK